MRATTTMSRALLSACLIVAAPGQVLRAAEGESTRRPNVLIVLVDDAGYGDFACHGHPFSKTPNIDRLHHVSLRLTDFHVAPMCTPTRGQLMTGLDALHNGACSVTAGRSFLRPAFRHCHNIWRMPVIARAYLASGTWETVIRTARWTRVFTMRSG